MASVVALSEASYGSKHIDRLPTATTTAHQTQLEPLKVERWLKLFRQRVSSHDARIRDLLQLPEAEWEAIEAKSVLGGALTPNETGLLLANAWLPAAFLDCLDPKSVHVENFKDELSDATIADGRALLLAAAQTAVLKVASEHEHAEADFDALRFKAGTSSEEVRRDALDLVRRFIRLPSRYNSADPAAIRMMLIKKLPDAVSAKRKELREKLMESEIMCSEAGKSHAERLVAPWTQDALIRIMAFSLHDAVPQANANGGDARKCLACGSTEHETTRCTKECPRGRVKSCPCLHGKPCPFKAAAKIEAGSLQNALGRKMPGGPARPIIEAHKRKFPQSYAAVEAPPEAAPAPAAAPAANATPSGHAAVLSSAIAGNLAPSLHAHTAVLPASLDAATLQAEEARFIAGLDTPPPRQLVFESPDASPPWQPDTHDGTAAAARGSPLLSDSVRAQHGCSYRLRHAAQSAPTVLRGDRFGELNTVFSYSDEEESTSARLGMPAVQRDGGLTIIDDDAVPSVLQNRHLAAAPSASVRVIDDDAVPNQMRNAALASAPPAPKPSAAPSSSSKRRRRRALASSNVNAQLRDASASPVVNDDAFPALGGASSAASAARSRTKGMRRLPPHAKPQPVHGPGFDSTGRTAAVKGIPSTRVGAEQASQQPPRELGRRARVRRARQAERAERASERAMRTERENVARLEAILSRFDTDVASVSFRGRPLA